MEEQNENLDVTSLGESEENTNASISKDFSPTDTDYTSEPSFIEIGDNYAIPSDIFPALDSDEFAQDTMTFDDIEPTQQMPDNDSDERQIEYDIFDNTANEPAQNGSEPQIVEINDEKKEYNPDKPRHIDVAFDFVELIIFSLIAVLLATTFFFRHSIVDGPSMENTLHHGEHLIISDLFYTPRRGDIIVCEDYSKSLSDPIVKRIIAVGGDRIQINALGEVYVNGERLTEDYISRKPASNGKPEIYNSIDMIVPEGKLFVMGDNRNNSTDSRHIGTIDEDSVLGKVLFRFYPFDKFGEV